MVFFIGVFVLVMGVTLGTALLIDAWRSRAKTKHLITSSEEVTPSSQEYPQFWGRKRTLPIDSELEKVNQQLARLRHQEPLSAKMLTRIKPFNPSKEQERLDSELRRVTNTLHGYPVTKPMVIAMPGHRITLNKELARVEKELMQLTQKSFPNVKVKSFIPVTEGHVRD